MKHMATGGIRYRVFASKLFPPWSSPMGRIGNKEIEVAMLKADYVQYIHTGKRCYDSQQQANETTTG